ncbi:MAG TPA: NAD-dependent epimerase/dehydratase family protein [Longimicrobiaceae bacterium]|nr:NAD-dependent epimerase/dehydratase family protein [Longimicrobiaceae bacterium]
MSNSALITGATGFVGSHLVERLAASGWRLRALVRRTSEVAHLERHGVERVVGSLADPDSIACGAEGVEVVFHLAAVTAAPGETQYLQANAVGTGAVVEGILRTSVRPRRMVYLSSYAACGPSPDGRPRTVEETPHPLTGYGRSKLEGERRLRALEGTGVDAVVVRAPAVYGPRDRALLTYFRLVKRGIAPSPAGERHLHLIYAPDLARALEGAAAAPPGTYAVAEPVAHTMTTLVDEIARALGKRPLRIPLPPTLVRAAAAVTEGAGRVVGITPAFNREKAEEMLAPGWICDLSGSGALLPLHEATPLAEGVARTARWYRNNGWL